MAIAIASSTGESSTSSTAARTMSSSRQVTAVNLTRVHDLDRLVGDASEWDAGGVHGIGSVG